MVLAAFGTHVEEAELESRARLEKGGTAIDEVERLARLFHLVAEIQETTVEELGGILAEGKFPIVFIDRSIFQLAPGQKAKPLHDATIHCVIPTRVTATSVTFHDPLPPRITRKAIRLFRQGYMRLGGHCVVCAKPRA